jgi:hypothetical protein
MANTISLHQRQVFLAAGDPAPYAKVYFYESGTETAVDVYSDITLLNVRARPVLCDSNGVMPACFTASPDPLRVLVTTSADVALPGYPMDNIVPLSAEEAAANTISFNPSDAIPQTDVQAAIEYVNAQFSGQEAQWSRALTPYVTGGTGNAYTLTPSPAITAYGTGQAFLVRPDRANTGAATMNVNGLGARDWQKIGPAGTPIALRAGEIAAGREVLVVDDGTRLLSVLGRDFPTKGSNENGTWIKHADGRIECWGSRVFDTGIGSAFMGGFESAERSWTYPTPYVSPPHVQMTAASGSCVSAIGKDGTTNTTTYFTVWAAAAQSSASRHVRLYATGY